MFVGCPEKVLLKLKETYGSNSRFTNTSSENSFGVPIVSSSDNIEEVHVNEQISPTLKPDEGIKFTY
jgi:hypothetical protein